MVSKYLLEELAIKVHEKWMKKRQDEGWTYGPIRNDSKKETPCLVPYIQLSEVEKDYDRATARVTIESLKELGYTIKKVNNRS